MSEEKREKSAFETGISLKTFAGDKPIVFRENIAYGKEEFEVPHSEMAMHVGVAGGTIKAIAIKKGAVCVAVEKIEGYSFACGISDELLPKELQNRLKLFGFTEEVI